MEAEWKLILQNSFDFEGGLNTQEDFENLLGYNLYSSALADMLSDPTLNMPITIGLFARWGSGKSFLLSKLKGLCALRLPHAMISNISES